MCFCNALTITQPCRTQSLQLYFWTLKHFWLSGARLRKCKWEQEIGSKRKKTSRDINRFFHLNKTYLHWALLANLIRPPAGKETTYGNAAERNKELRKPNRFSSPFYFNNWEENQQLQNSFKDIKTYILTPNFDFV